MGDSAINCMSKAPSNPFTSQISITSIKVVLKSSRKLNKDYLVLDLKIPTPGYYIYFTPFYNGYLCIDHYLIYPKFYPLDAGNFPYLPYIGLTFECWLD